MLQPRSCGSRRRARGLDVDGRRLRLRTESIGADAQALTDEQRPELDYRVARYEKNPSNVVPWERVKAGLFKKQ